jgi:hypothetical protein
MFAHRAVKQSAEKAGEHEPLYVTEHIVANDFDFPTAFRVDALPGLVFCQVLVQAEKERRVVAWWKSRETFAEAWSKQFAQLLGTHATLCFEGFQLTHQVRPNPIGWLRPTAIVAGVGAVVALLTGLSTIEDFGYSLLAIPDCTLWADPLATGKPRNVGDAFGIQIQVKNRHLRASSIVTLKPHLVPGGGVKLDEENAESPYSVQVQPGKAEVEEFRFVTTDTGRQTILFEGKEEAGSLQGQRNIPPFRVTIEVWDPIDQAPRLSLVRSSDRAAIVLVEVHNAKPTPFGIVLEATLEKPGDVKVEPDSLTIRDADAPLSNADFAKLSWRMPPSTEALTVESVRLVLQGSGAQTRNENEWNELLKRLTVHVAEPDELSSPVQTK